MATEWPYWNLTIILRDKLAPKKFSFKREYCELTKVYQIVIYIPFFFIMWHKSRYKGLFDFQNEWNLFDMCPECGGRYSKKECGCNETN